MKVGLTYNERSWAIDLISHLKEVTSKQNRVIKEVGGEQTVRLEGGCLFPDVLLFGDKYFGRILQGWELKMPDTAIDDIKFRNNAEKKAKVLGLDSFVLWNVSRARLFLKNSDDSGYRAMKEWKTDIRSREDVKQNHLEWKRLASEIVSVVNDMLEGKRIMGRSFVEAYKSGGVTSLLLENAGDVSNMLEAASIKNSELRANIRNWWGVNELELGKSNSEMYFELAKSNICNWIGKFLFGHLLQRTDSRASVINGIGKDTSPDEALCRFRKLTESCNFWNVFSPSGTGLALVPQGAWTQLCEFNNFLTGIRIHEVDQELYSELLSATTSVAKKEVRGQYVTPLQLARLLIELCVDDIEEDRVLDPCCGSGTIAAAALEQKRNAEIPIDKAVAKVVAVDIDPLAVQIATFALVKPDFVDLPLRIDCANSLRLTKNSKLTTRDPRSGQVIEECYGKFHAIIGNLPFIGQSGREAYMKDINYVNNQVLNKSESLLLKSDISAYFPFVFHKLLEANGRLGIIITNAWQSTAWGEKFISLVEKYYWVRYIITSGAGRWFKNSKVIVNLLILESRERNTEIRDDTRFVVLHRPLEELCDLSAIQDVATQIHTGFSQRESVGIRTVSRSMLNKLREYGLGGNAQFVDTDWVVDLPLCPLSKYFMISRGERRGWDDMFYPSEDHGIEPEYIKPVLKSPKDVHGYVCKATGDAFCCSRSLGELKELGHSGALSWIERFEHSVNKKGEPLKSALARKGMYWYEMRADKLANLVLPINVDERLFISKFKEQSFVNQRLIALKTMQEEDVDVCHALLNSTVGLFMIEGLGFGRGEGVLDLSKDRVERNMHILDIDLLSQKQRLRIVSSFESLKSREVLGLNDELESSDRNEFDDTVLDMYKISELRGRIYESLINLVSMRKAASQT